MYADLKHKESENSALSLSLFIALVIDKGEDNHTFLMSLLSIQCYQLSIIGRLRYFVHHNPQEVLLRDLDYKIR